MLSRVMIGILVAFFLLSEASAAQLARAGVGLILFEPSGLTGKAWLSRSAALAGDSNLDLDFYLGAGGKIVFRDYDNAWLRLPLGIDFLLRMSPLNFFFELVPTFDFSDLKLFGAIGFRYVFQR